MEDKVIDLVCGMEFEKKAAAGSFEHEGQMYYFCSIGCRDAFAREPERYIRRELAEKE